MIRLSLFSQRRPWFVISATIVFMLFSLYMPYSRAVSFAYQIAIFVVVVLFAFDTGNSVFALLILSTVRSYIAVSTQKSDLISAKSNYLGLSGTVLLMIVAAVGLIFLLKHKFVIKITAPRLFMFLLAVLMLSSKSWASNLAEYSDNFDAICLMYIVVPWLFYSKEDVLVARLAFVIAGAFLAFGIIPNMKTAGTIYDVIMKVDRNYLSCMILMCILECVVFLLKEGRNSKWYVKAFCLLVIALDLYIIMINASRSALLAIVIAGIMYILVNIKHMRRVFAFALLATIALLFALEMGWLNTVLNRFELPNIQSANGRTQLWEGYLRGFSSGNIFEVIFGHGLIGLSVVGNVAHNIFVSILYSFGLAGLICICGTLLILIKQFVSTGNGVELIPLLPIIFMCCTIEPYYRIEFAIFISMAIGVAGLSKEGEIYERI